MPKRRPPAPVTASLMTNTVVRAAPTSTTNITGFFATVLGLSFMNDSLVARLRISGSKSGRARTPLEMSCAPSGLASGFGCFCCRGGTVTVDISKHLSVQHMEVLNYGAHRERWKVRQRANDDDGSNQEDDEQRSVGRQRTAGHGNELLRSQAARDS